MRNIYVGKKAVNEQGNEVKIGEIVQDCRKNKAVLTHLTRARTEYKSGLVCVEWLDNEGNKTGATGEYYDRVFNIKVVEIYEEIK